MSKVKAENIHRPVLLKETLQFLRPQAGEIFVDATLGLGGHSAVILEAAENVRLIGIDQDREAIELARERLAAFGEKAQFYHANFSAIKQVLAEAKIERTDGVLADLGISSLQLDSPSRGFSFRFDAPLDMRMNADAATATAAELLETLSEEEMADLIYNYGEEKFSRRIARRIVEKRKKGAPIRRTGELAETVEKAIGRRPKDKIHPATRTFQALRIAVNGELDVLEDFVRNAVDVLKIDGRLAVITFHSLEDRVIKQTMQKLAGKCFCPPRLPACNCGAEKKIEILTRKPVAPQESEVEENPRARSAKLRVCVKSK